MPWSSCLFQLGPCKCHLPASTCIASLTRTEGYARDFTATRLWFQPGCPSPRGCDHGQATSPAGASSVKRGAAVYKVLSAVSVPQQVLNEHPLFFLVGRLHQPRLGVPEAPSNGIRSAQSSGRGVSQGNCGLHPRTPPIEPYRGSAIQRDRLARCLCPF